MIVIKVEMWPHGDASKAYPLGSAFIANEGRTPAEEFLHAFGEALGTSTRGNYKCRFMDRAGRLWKACRVTNFPRKKLLAWDLLYRALREAIGDRN